MTKPFRDAPPALEGVSLTQEEVAERLGISKQLVAYYEHKAIRKLRKLLAQEACECFLDEGHRAG